ncbi:hypothetical protein E6C55_18325 [Cohnella fermenti]|uniref:MalT-like TPR region domain-containing protein n=1 Tax=Cohnella fermenti TaxID=2565925 RepID=A0A4V3WEK3_9BACL|nr:hypothetical protein E6C55_18325 [Cohnella fermenti]
MLQIKRYGYVTILRAHLCLGLVREGLAYGERLAQYAESMNLQYYRAEINLLLALLYHADGDEAAAIRKLARSLETGSRHG